jgi:hypothetical protein
MMLFAEPIFEVLAAASMYMNAPTRNMKRAQSPTIQIASLYTALRYPARLRFVESTPGIFSRRV